MESVFQVHHGQPGGDVHGAADAVQQDVRHGPRAADGWARRGPVTAQAGVRPAPVSKAFIQSIFSLIFCCWLFFHFLGNIMRPAPSHSFATPTTVRNCFEILLFPAVASQTGPGQDKSRNCSIFTIFSPSFPSIWADQQTGLMSNILGYCEPRSRSYLSSIINGIISTEKKIISPLRRG